MLACLMLNQIPGKFDIWKLATKFQITLFIKMCSTYKNLEVDHPSSETLGVPGFQLAVVIKTFIPSDTPIWMCALFGGAIPLNCSS